MFRADDRSAELAIGPQRQVPLRDRMQLLINALRNEVYWEGSSRHSQLAYLAELMCLDLRGPDVVLWQFYEEAFGRGQVPGWVLGPEGLFPVTSDEKLTHVRLSLPSPPSILPFTALPSPAMQPPVIAFQVGDLFSYELFCETLNVLARHSLPLQQALRENWKFKGAGPRSDSIQRSLYQNALRTACLFTRTYQTARLNAARENLRDVPAPQVVSPPAPPSVSSIPGRFSRLDLSD